MYLKLDQTSLSDLDKVKVYSKMAFIKHAQNYEKLNLYDVCLCTALIEKKC